MNDPPLLPLKRDAAGNLMKYGVEGLRGQWLLKSLGGTLFKHAAFPKRAENPPQVG
jgi:hypothetical protein